MNKLIEKVLLFSVSLCIHLGWSFTTPDYFPRGWELNMGTPPNVKKEYRTIKDAGAYKGTSYAFVRGHLMSSQEEVSGGDELEISFYAKDPDGQQVSCLLYTYSRDEGRLRYTGTMTGFSGIATPEWKLFTGTVKIPVENGDKDKVTPGKKPVDAAIVVLASNTGAYFDYPSIIHIKMKQWKNPECARNEARGRLKFSLGYYDESLDAFKKALNLAETDDERKVITSRIEETRRAMKTARTMEKIGNRLSLSDTLEQQGNNRESRRQYEVIKNLSVANSDYLKEFALLNIARLYQLEKDYRNAHRTYKEFFSISGLEPFYRIYGLFRQAELYIQEKQYRQARSVYQDIQSVVGGLEYHCLISRLYEGDTYRMERQYSRARKIYETLLRQQDTSNFPHEGFRVEIIKRLEAIEGLVDRQAEKSMEEKLTAIVNSPKYHLYVSLSGNDANAGTKDKPFATIQRAQQEICRIKNERGMPKGGITVYIRAGRYFVGEGIIFGQEDSGIEGCPVVYRGYPGEEVRLIGGKQVTNFSLVSEPDIIKLLPEEARGKIWVADLKAAGIEDYGQLFNRGHSGGALQPSAMELFYNSQPMHLARWPKDGWARTSLIEPEGDTKINNRPVHKGRFRYDFDRAARWKEEKDIWAVGYFLWEWDRIHTKVTSIDVENKIVHLAQDKRHHPTYPAYNMPVRDDAPYYFYNIFSELSAPGEFYIDRDTGRLYFYPPGKIEGSEIIVSTLKTSLIEMVKNSHTVLLDLTLEGTWRNAVEMKGCKNNLVAGCTIRNTGDLGILVEGGWNNHIIGCDIYDTGEGGIFLKGEGWDRLKGDAKLIPCGNVIENNHIHRFNRFSFGGGGGMGISISGIGNKVSHNLLHDGPYICIIFDGNDNIIEYNEIYDVTHEARDGGAIYTYGEPRYLMNRGNVIRYNFIHHITQHSSPIKTHQVTGIYVDALNGGMTKEGNILYHCTERAMFAHGPDNRIENNFFIDNNLGITLADRSWILDSTKINTEIPAHEERLKLARYKQPPWSYRYPQLTGLFQQTLPLGRIENNVIERNISIGAPFMTGMPEEGKNTVRYNWQGYNPMFVDDGKMDFRIRTGSPVFGTDGVQPLPFEKIGVYESSLRAIWPVKRARVGKYYKP